MFRSLSSIFLCLTLTMSYAQNVVKDYENGDHYEGMMRDGLRHGKGTLTYKNGNIYTGAFVNDYAEGKGTLVYKSGTTYTGEFKKGRYWGKGKLMMSNNCTIEGTFEDGQPEGQCTAIDSVGTTYKCNYHLGEMDGYGTMLVTKGPFKGTTYKGYFKRSRFNGHGVFDCNDGTHYEGNYINGYPAGIGKGHFVYSDCELDYEGELQEGKFHGEGKLTYTTGNWKGISYEGEFRIGSFHGSGTMYLPDKRKIVGTWLKGEMNGKMIEYYPDGSYKAYLYENGKYIKDWEDNKTPNQSSEHEAPITLD